MPAGSRGGTFMVHVAIPIARHDSLGRTVWKCRDCTRHVHERKSGGRAIWVHTAAKRRRRTP